MGRFEVLKANKISTSTIDVVTELDKSAVVAIDAINKQLGQYKSIIVCESEKGYEIVDGNKYFKSLKRNGVKKILCYNLGKINIGELEFYRIALNIHQSRLDYIGVAELVSKLAKQEHKTTTISNKTGIELQNVERYSTLLDFDWNEFNKVQLKQQTNPFENER